MWLRLLSLLGEYVMQRAEHSHLTVYMYECVYMCLFSL